MSEKSPTTRVKVSALRGLEQLVASVMESGTVAEALCLELLDAIQDGLKDYDAMCERNRRIAKERETRRRERKRAAPASHVSCSQSDAGGDTAQNTPPAGAFGPEQPAKHVSCSTESTYRAPSDYNKNLIDSDIYQNQSEKKKGYGGKETSERTVHTAYHRPTLGECVNFITGQGGTPQQARSFYRYNERRGWTARGEAVYNWQGLAVGWFRCVCEKAALIPAPPKPEDKPTTAPKNILAVDAQTVLKRLHRGRRADAAPA